MDPDVGEDGRIAEAEPGTELDAQLAERLLRVDVAVRDDEREVAVRGPGGPGGFQDKLVTALDTDKNGTISAAEPSPRS